MKPVAPAEFVAAPARLPLVTRRRVLHGVGGIAFAGLATVGYGAGAEAQSLMVTRYRPAPRNWPARLRLTVAVISDLHAGGPNMGVAHVRRAVDTANALSPDLMLLLGDFFATHRFITEHVPHPVWAAELARLKAPLGVYAVFGNHDWWHNIAATRAALAGVGLPALENRAVRLAKDGQPFWLAGLGDQLAHKLGPGWYQGEDDLPGTLAQIGDDAPVILMAHEPDIFVDVPDRVALTLSGHTHGGQIRVPFVWQRLVPSRYGARFAYGHVVENDRHLIVSGGLGTSGVPVRLGVPPEIVHITLGGT
ncbi:metallophosphoesterase [Xanthobacteraceae bacterium Astr-EGSB]|uniref:metallophosphoesterase n=1 Tax=Astrobacterium formosum TaxID=3069710 RepID=UPI0027B32AF4|nr:metallophosphoesterase [Xanthobacteraceae bacterium Astr-EGSB]